MRGWIASLLVAGCTVVPSIASAQFLGLVGVDVMQQSVRQRGHSSITGTAIRGRIENDDLPIGITLMPSIDYWRDKDVLDDFGVVAVQRDWRFGVDARYDWQWGNWSPYAGGGLALHDIETRYSAPGQPESEVGHSKIGPDVFLGLQLAPTGWLQSFVEVKYDFVSNYSQFKFNYGFGINF
jgi:opacity protein-like surface antigen